MKTIDWPVFQTRGKVLALIRSFFTERGFLEVESPILTPYPTLDMNILSMESCFVNNSDAPYTLYLHTSPEHAMKKMLALGAERIFYLGKVFRNSELSDMHHPEFTMLEWYRPHADLQTMQQDTTELIVFLAEQCLDSPVIQVNKHNISLSLPWQEATLRHCFLKKTGFDLIADKSLAGLQACANALGIHYGEGDDWQTLFFRIFLERIESSLGIETPLFLSEYPAEMALMARTKPGAPEWVERSELYIGGIELANGYTECTDREVMRSRFEHEMTLRRLEGMSPGIMDKELLEALDRLPPCAGMSLGIDRLIMLFTGKSHIREVILFPIHDYMEQSDEDEDRAP